MTEMSEGGRRPGTLLGAVRPFVATPLRCGLVAGLILAVLAVGRWESGGRHWTYFAVVGSEFADSTELPVPTPLAPNPRGYDGQFFLALTWDPWPEASEVHGIRLGDPSYRHQRIGLPALAWSLSLGRAELAPAALVLVNILALALGVGICGTLAADFDRSPALGFGLLGISGLLLAFGRDLAEPLTVVFLSAAALSLHRGNLLVAAVALTGAVLTREDALLAVFALAVAALVSRRLRPARPGVVLAVLLPSVAIVTWQLVLSAHWGSLPALASSDRLAVPLAGPVGTWPTLTGQPVTESAVYFLYILWHVLLAVEVGRRLGGRTIAGEGDRFFVWWVQGSWLLWGVLALCLSTSVWEDEWALARVLAQWSFFGFLLLLVGRWTPSRQLVALTLLLVTGSAVRLLLHP